MGDRFAARARVNLLGLVLAPAFVLACTSTPPPKEFTLDLPSVSPAPVSSDAETSPSSCPPIDVYLIDARSNVETLGQAAEFRVVADDVFDWVARSIAAEPSLRLVGTSTGAAQPVESVIDDAQRLRLMRVGLIIRAMATQAVVAFAADDMLSPSDASTRVYRAQVPLEGGVRPFSPTWTTQAVERGTRYQAKFHTQEWARGIDEALHIALAQFVAEMTEPSADGRGRAISCAQDS